MNTTKDKFSPESIFRINIMIALFFYATMPLLYLVEGEIGAGLTMAVIGCIAFFIAVGMKERVSRNTKIYTLVLSEMLTITIPAFFSVGTPHIYSALAAGSVLTGLYFNYSVSLLSSIIFSSLALVFTVFNSYFIPGYDFSFLIKGWVFMVVACVSTVIFVKMVTVKIEVENLKNNENELMLKKLEVQIREVELQKSQQSRMVDEIKGISSNLAINADNMLLVVNELSNGSTRQSVAVADIVTTVSEVAVVSRKNVDDAKRAKELSDTSNTQLSDGRQQMKKMTRAMDDISNTANEINNIIKSIENIAFQTNILALNAAVEAARAGSAGKGFAVVAGEVRSLASLSSEAVKNTDTMISNTIQAVNTGKMIVQNTAESMEKIIESIEAINLIIDKINISSDEQSLFISQVEQSLNSISEVISKNTSTAEETTESTNEIHQQVQKLNGLIG